MDALLNAICASEFKLFRLISNTKRPVDNGGFHNAERKLKPETLHGYNVGLRCGEGFFVVDVDPKHGGNITLNGLLLGFGSLPETVTVKTPSGGTHYYFQGRVKTDHRTLQGIDIQSDGTYVVCPPSSIEGVYYEWVDGCAPWECEVAAAPEWLIDLLNRNQDPVQTFTTKLATEYDLVRLKKALWHVSPDCSHEIWIRIGMAIHSTGLPNAFDLWESWSRGDLHNRICGKFDEADLQRRWKSFTQTKGINIGTAFYICEEEMLENLTVDQIAMVQAEEIIESEDDKWKTEYLNELRLTEFEPPSRGHLKTLYDWYMDSCFNKHPEFALGSALTLVGCLISRSYMHESKTTAIMYNVIVGRAACGKDDYLKQTRAAVSWIDQSRKTRILSDEMRSDQAMKRTLCEYPVRLMTWDEIHEHIKRGYSSHDTPAKEIFRFLKEMWASQDEMTASVKRSKQETINSVKMPRISLLSACVPEGLEAALHNPEVVDGGFFSRCDLWFQNEQEIVSSKDRYERRLKQKPIGIPNSVMVALSRLVKQDDVVLAGENAFAEITFREQNLITMSAEARAFYNTECDKIYRYMSLTDPYCHSVLARSQEKALRYALITCVSREAHEIDLEDMRYAFTIAKGRLYLQLKFLGQSLESEHSKLRRIVAQRVLDVVAQGKEHFTATDLFRSGPRILRQKETFRMKQELIADLVKSGAIQNISRARNNKSTFEAYSIASQEILESLL